MLDQIECSVVGCTNLGQYRGASKTGKRTYHSMCTKHRRETTLINWRGRGTIANLKCEVCGWDKDACDRHRIEPKLGYTKDNVRILCPNCHRLVTNGKLEIR